MWRAESHCPCLHAFHGPGYRISEALQDFSSAVELDPQSALSYNARGVLLQNNGQLQQALEDFDVAIQLRPDSHMYMLNRAACKKAMGDVQGCIADLSHALEIQPEELSALIQV